MFEKKIDLFIKRFVIYGLIVILGLPLSLFVASIKPAQASQKPKTVAVQKTVEKPVVAKMSFLRGPTGLFRGNTYVTGQSISMQVTLSGEPSLVWAEASVLDPNFPAKIYFQNEGQGIWNLKTPKLSNDLNVGSFTIKIFAQDANLKTIQAQTKITLRQFRAVTVSSYKVNGDGTANITWNSLPWADVYLVNWQIQGDNASNKFEKTKLQTITLKNLVPGTFYEVSIQPLRGDAVGPVTKVIFKTLGETPAKLVAGESVLVEPVKITPTIGSGVSTTKKVAQTTPPAVSQATPKETPSASPSPSPQESAKPSTGGWSKILIALSILIIAAGAAIGGYYGYEWLMLRSKDKEDQEPPKSSNRW